MPFARLYRKEVKGIFPLFVVFAAVVVAWHAFILYKSETWDHDLVFVLSLIMPFVAAGLLAVGASYAQLHTEWRTNSIYLLMALPMAGWKVLTAKLLSALTLLIGSAAAVGISFAALLLRAKWEELTGNAELQFMLPTLISLTWNVFWLSCLSAALVMILVQFAYLCGQMAARLKWLFVLCAFVGGLWLVIRITPPLSGLFLWTPDFIVGAEGGEAAYMQSGPFLILTLVGIGFMWINGYIFDKEVEV
ncbi:hypothetical protein MO973_23370 [Paenibacillus sp. TRM 82003]|nr:hypothetical protein [Paenibacillus sp. TRM 82003]